jgi:hypothetical protein
MPTLEELKGYLRIDGSEDDSNLALLLLAAKEFLLNAGVPEQEGALYKLAIMRFVSVQHENKGPDVKDDRSLISLIWQLKSFTPLV